MFINFYDYVIQIFEWCQLNCLNFKNHSINTIDTIKPKETINLKNNKNLSENYFFDDWVDYGFGKNEIIH